jgi:RNA polymerase sigma-70 factor (ECF subfamily)
MDEMVIRAQAGDHAAFEALAAASIHRLYAIASRVLRDPHAAEDAVQDCLVRAWRDLRALRDPARLDAWLYRLLMHACRDQQRRQPRHIADLGAVAYEVAAPGDAIADVDRRDQIQRGFLRLTAEHRMVLVLHHYLGLRPREIADLLGIPDGTATSRIHYGTRALRSALEADLAVAAVEAGSRS